MILTRALWRLGMPLHRFGGSKPQPVDKSEQVQVPPGNPEVRDKLQLQFMDNYEKSFLYEHIKQRSPFTLYSFINRLPLSVSKHIGRLCADTKVKLTSDALYPPRLTKNGVPIYESPQTSSVFQLMRNLEFAPFVMFALAHYPQTMAVLSLFAYFIVYKPTIQEFTKTFVIKMELIPETEELLLQRIGAFGFIKTTRIKINDIEHYEGQDFAKEKVFLYRFSRSFVDDKMIFRIKSTGELLTFDKEGYWFEEGLNHRLMV